VAQPYTSFECDNTEIGVSYIVNLNTVLVAYQGGGSSTPIPSKPYLGAILLPSGTVGIAYAAEGTIDPPSVLAPITYTISSGSLPPGLSLSSPDASREWEISGTPTTAGSYTFTLTATNGLGSDSTSITLVIAAKPASNYGWVS
jgi:PKD repeat protein